MFLPNMFRLLSLKLVPHLSTCAPYTTKYGEKSINPLCDQPTQRLLQFYDKLNLYHLSQQHVWLLYLAGLQIEWWWIRQTKNKPSWYLLDRRSFLLWHWSSKKNNGITYIIHRLPKCIIQRMHKLQAILYIWVEINFPQQLFVFCQACFFHSGIDCWYYL